MEEEPVVPDMAAGKSVQKSGAPEGAEGEDGGGAAGTSTPESMESPPLKNRWGASSAISARTAAARKASVSEDSSGAGPDRAVASGRTLVLSFPARGLTCVTSGAKGW